jgi:alpha-ribazole phosphatase
MRLWLVRHAVPLVSPGVCYGVTDVKADAGHTSQAARALADVLPRAIGPVRTSPLRRCAQLARALNKLRPELDPVTDPRLQEMNFGTWESQAWADIPRQALDAWIADFAGHAFGGQENIQGFMSRVASALQETRAGAAEHPGRDAVWITHAGVIRAVQLLTDGTGVPVTADQWPKVAVPCGEWAVLDLPGPR